MVRKVATVATRGSKLRQMLADEIISGPDGMETYGKFRLTGSELTNNPTVFPSTTNQQRLDSLSLSSQDFQLFNNELRSTNTSEYFSFSLTTRSKKLRLPEFGQDDILVKPNSSSNNNWILLPTSDYEKWQQRRGAGPTTSNAAAASQQQSTNHHSSKVEQEQQDFIQRALISILQFIGPKSKEPQ
jgi:hypothetical protein